MELTGRLVGDAEIRKTKDKKELVAFSIAVNDYYKTKQGEKVEQTEYFQCSYWLSTKIADNLQKGSIVTVTGRVYLNEYTGKDGQHHANIACHASNVKIVATFKGNGTAKPATAKATTPQTTSNGTTEPTDDLPF